ncbi:MAG: hypothetical protein IPJ77_07360 [Planctomycetes bacterium]|nr:hypothetical protein [Planctomycetota bacterium]
MFDYTLGAGRNWAINPVTGEIGNGQWDQAAISGQGDVSAVRTNTTNIDPGDTNDIYDIYVASEPSAICTVPTTYCIGSPNSVGFGAQIGWTGSLRLADNSFYLTVSGCPPNTTGLFFYGPDQQQVPYFSGYLCVSPGTLGFFRVGTNSANALGQVAHQVRFDFPPAAFGTGQITPGSAWNFQFWYRNPGGGGAGANTSNALHASFCP